MRTDTGHRVRQEDVCWQNRSDMVLHALRHSLPWFAAVNVSFAIMVLLREVLFEDIDNTLRGAHGLLPWLDGGMLLILFAAPGLAVMVSKSNPAGALRRCLPGILLAGMSIIWSIATYGFVVLWQLPFGWPLVCVLLLSGLTALYFIPAYLCCFILPLWLTLPFISLQLNQGMNPRFLAVWCILAFVLAYGRRNLQRWFDEAWARYAENQLLIGRLNLLTSLDALTGIANRRALDSHLSLLSAQHSACALLMLDVDYFKRYNDHYGHQAGDECLKAVADVLRKAVRQPQDLVARYGGEEFVLVLTGADAEQAATVAVRIRQLLRHAALPHAESEVSAFVTVSTGIAVAAGHWSASELIARADAALYRAKGDGRDCWSAS